MDNWLVIIVGVIFLVCIVVGAVRGFFKIGLSLLSSVLTVVIMLYLSPYVGDALTKFTPLDEMIEERCVQAFMPEISVDIFAGKDLSGTPLAELDEDQLQAIGELDLDRYGITAQDILGVIGEIPQDQQIQQIEESLLPDFLKDKLLENNNSTIYEMLGVSTFPEYVAAYISRMVVKVVSFLVTFLLAIIIVKALMVAVDILGELPGVGALNRFGGAMVGIFAALLIVWLMFLVITVLYSTEIGASCFEMIEQSKILTFLYEKNVLLTKLLAFK